MKMKRYYCLILGVLFYIISIVLISPFLIYLPKMITKETVVDFDTLLRMIIITFICIFLGWIFIKQSNVIRSKTTKINLIVILFLNTFFLMCGMFFMIREGVPIINLIPFRETIIQVYLYLTGNISILYILKNILLYFIFLIPTGACLYYIFDKAKDFNYYIIIMLLISFIFEGLKFLLYKRFNIDNILLSNIGCSIAYFVVNYFTKSNFINNNI